MTFILIPGAGGAAWYWHRVIPLLEAVGHAAVAVDLPGDDERAGLDVYAQRVVDAAGSSPDVVLVAQSLGAFTAPVVCERLAVRALVLVNAMIPKPGETAGEWWGNTRPEPARQAAARKNGYPTEFDLATYFLHDVPAEVAQDGARHARPEAKIVFAEPCPFTRWPDVSIHVVAGADDRFFPVDFQRRVARQRLGADVETLPGGHLVALSNPKGLSDLLVRYAA